MLSSSANIIALGWQVQGWCFGINDQLVNIKETEWKDVMCIRKVDV